MLYTLRLTDEDVVELTLMLGVAMAHKGDLPPATQLAVDRLLAQVGGKPYWHEENDPLLRPKGEG